MRTSVLAVVIAAVLAPMAATAAATGQLRLAAPRKIDRANQMIPRIAAPSTPATAAINAANARLDARWRAFVRQCPRDADGQPWSTGRKVSVSLAGSAYVTFLVETDASCGWMQPDEAQLGLTYDLRTGRPVDWSTLLPASLEADFGTDDLIDGTKVGTIGSARLWTLYVDAVLKDRESDEYFAECRAVIRESAYGLQIWPDANAGALVMAAVDVPHVSAACMPAVAVPTSAFRPLGVNAGLLDEIDRAHRAGR